MSTMTVNRNFAEVEKPNHVLFPLEKKYEGISVTERSEDLWMVNNRGEVFEGDYESVLIYVIDLVNEINRGQ